MQLSHSLSIVMCSACACRYRACALTTLTDQLIPTVHSVPAGRCGPCQLTMWLYQHHSLHGRQLSAHKHKLHYHSIQQRQPQAWTAFLPYHHVRPCNALLPCMSCTDPVHNCPASQVDLEALLADDSSSKTKLKKPKKPTAKAGKSKGSSKASTPSSSNGNSPAGSTASTPVASMEMTFEEPEPVPAGVVDAGSFDEEDDRRQSGSSGISSGLRLENVIGALDFRIYGWWVVGACKFWEFPLKFGGLDGCPAGLRVRVVVLHSRSRSEWLPP